MDWKPEKLTFTEFSPKNVAGPSLLSDVSSFSTGSFEFNSDSLKNEGLLLWLDASDVNGDGNLSNEPFGGTVDQWRDRSGGGRHAENGNGPRLLVNGLNSLSVLKFDGVNNYLRIPFI